ncbi:LOG family [Dillenia turbinata]|uniref:Cytokinin riboside 5'-monophosphate phosphoribohydrolase n=1 Tax=Dillenia turbinata TaxID=194707 RepID=A0AAN8ZQ25_9MAGN
MEDTKSRFKRICVFCGSNSGAKASYKEAATELGKLLVEKKIDLVYGGGSGGLMGIVSQAVLDGGSHVLGFVPCLSLKWHPSFYSTSFSFHWHGHKLCHMGKVTGSPVGEVIIVSNIHERKAEMARHADAFIALPGGYGTLEELLEVLSWAQLNIHNKPVGLLNVDGFYSPLLSFLDKATDEGFISQKSRGIIVSAPTAKELLSILEEHNPELDDVLGKLVWEDVWANGNVQDKVAA